MTPLCVGVGAPQGEDEGAVEGRLKVGLPSVMPASMHALELLFLAAVRIMSKTFKVASLGAVPPKPCLSPLDLVVILRFVEVADESSVEAAPSLASW